MGISKYAKATYGWPVDWNLIETVTETEVASCGHTETLQKIMHQGLEDLPYCPVCGARVGIRPSFTRYYTDIVEEVPEDDIDGYYITCKGYPVYKKDKEYSDEPDLAYIGITIGEDESISLIDEDIRDMERLLVPLFGFAKLYCWTEYA